MSTRRGRFVPAAIKTSLVIVRSRSALNSLYFIRIDVRHHLQLRSKVIPVSKSSPAVNIQNVCSTELFHKNCKGMIRGSGNQKTDFNFSSPFRLAGTASGSCPAAGSDDRAMSPLDSSGDYAAPARPLGMGRPVNRFHDRAMNGNCPLGQGSAFMLSALSPSSRMKGHSRRKHVPTPGRVRTVIVPPCSWRIFWLTASPSPVPLKPLLDSNN